MFAFVILLSTCSAGISSGFSQFGCQFEDADYNLKLGPKREPVFGQAVEPIQMTNSEHSDFYDDVQTIAAQVFESVIMNDFQGYVDFIRAYKDAKENAAGTKIDLTLRDRKKLTQQIKDVSQKSVKRGFKFDEFFRDYKPQLKVYDTTSLVIEVLNRVIKKYPHVANATYLAPVLYASDDEELRTTGTFYNFVAGIVKIHLIEAKLPNAKLYSYTFINQRFPLHPLGVLVKEEIIDDDEDVKINDDEVEILNEDESLTTSDEKGPDDPTRKSVVEISFEDHKGSLFIRIDSGEVFTPEDSFIAMVNVTRPFCSFMDEVKKMNLLLPLHSMIKRNEFGDYEFFVSVHMKRPVKGVVPALSFYKDIENGALRTNLNIFDDSKQTQNMNSDLIYDVISSLNLSIEEIYESKSLLAYAIEDPLFIRQCKSYFLSNVKLYKPFGTEEDDLHSRKKIAVLTNQR